MTCQNKNKIQLKKNIYISRRQTENLTLLYSHKVYSAFHVSPIQFKTFLF